VDKTIETLRLELQYRKKELSEEKEISRKVQKELDDSRRLSSQTLQSLTSQNEMILKTLQEQKNCAQDAETTAREQNEKMNAVIKDLEQIKTKVADPAAMTEPLKSIQEDAIKRLTTEIQKTASGNAISDQDKQAWTDNIQTIKNLCERIIEDWVENDQDVAEWQEMYEHATEKLYHAESWRQKTSIDLEAARAKLDEVVNANTEFDKVNRHLNGEVESLAEKVEELQGDIDASRGIELENEDLLIEVGSLKEQIKKLQGEVDVSRNSESSKVAALQVQLSKKGKDLEKSDEKLKEAEGRLRVQDELLKENEVSMRSGRQNLQEMQQVLNTANQERQQTISEAVRKETRRLQDMQRDTKSRLDSAEKARIKSMKDLQNATEQIQQLSSVTASNGQDTRKLNATMQDATRKVVKLMNELATVKKLQEDMKKQLEQWILDKPELARMREQFNKIEQYLPTVLEAETQMIQLIQRCEQHAETEQGNTLDEVPVDGSSPPNHPTPTISSSDDSQTRARHVVMKSPIETEAVLAPSVLQEREKRRQSVPVKSIIKTRSASKEIAAQTQDNKAQSQPDPAPAQQNQKE
jgi:chromosome segregation ATPase